MAVNRTDFYPLARDFPIPSILIKMGFKEKEFGSVRAQWTGEKRPPKKGEWFLSGAEVEAYYAPNDLAQPQLIARLVKTKTITVMVEEETHVREQVRSGGG